MLVTSVFLSINWKYYVNIILFNWTLILGMCFQYYSRCLSGVLTYVWWVGTHKIHISNTEHSMWPVSNGYRTCDDPSYPIGESEHCLVKIVESIYRHRPTNAQSVRASTWTELHIRIMWKMMRINRAYNAQQNNVNSSGMRYVHRSYPNIPHAHTHTLLMPACTHVVAFARHPTRSTRTRANISEMFYQCTFIQLCGRVCMIMFIWWRYSNRHGWCSFVIAGWR